MLRNIRRSINKFFVCNNYKFASKTLQKFNCSPKKRFNHQIINNFPTLNIPLAIILKQKRIQILLSLLMQFCSYFIPSSNFFNFFSQNFFNSVEFIKKSYVWYLFKMQIFIIKFIHTL